jgi:hypothetical protein
MNHTVQVVAVAVSLGFLLAVLELVRRRRLTEEYSFLWIGFALLLLVLSLWREILHTVARWLGVYYPPAVLLLALLLFVFVASLYFSVVISRQRRQIERLVEDMAILAAEVREAREEKAAGVASHKPPPPLPPAG